jgi:hypothetical protein
MPHALFTNDIPKETWLSHFGTIMGTVFLKKNLPTSLQLNEPNIIPSWENFSHLCYPVVMNFNSSSNPTIICTTKKEYLEATEEIENKCPRIIYSVPIKKLKEISEFISF